MFTEQEGLETEVERTNLLPQPSKRVVLLVLAKLIVDRTAFSNSAAETLIEENPELADFVIRGSRLSPDPQFALISALALYECYSLAASRIGQRLFLVTDDTVHTLGVDIMKDASIGTDYVMARMGDIRTHAMAMGIMMEHFTHQALTEIELRHDSRQRDSLTHMMITFNLLRAQEEVNRLNAAFGEQAFGKV